MEGFLMYQHNNAQEFIMDRDDDFDDDDERNDKHLARYE
jgi:hypothetical protein